MYEVESWSPAQAPSWLPKLGDKDPTGNSGMGAQPGPLWATSGLDHHKRVLLKGAHWHCPSVVTEVGMEGISLFASYGSFEFNGVLLEGRDSIYQVWETATTPLCSRVQDWEGGRISPG